MQVEGPGLLGCRSPQGGGEGRGLRSRTPANRSVGGPQRQFTEYRLGVECPYTGCVDEIFEGLRNHKKK